MKRLLFLLWLTGSVPAAQSDTIAVPSHRLWFSRPFGQPRILLTATYTPNDYFRGLVEKQQVIGSGMGSQNAGG